MRGRHPEFLAISLTAVNPALSTIARIPQPSAECA
jgi:hypothetical protein